MLMRSERYSKKWLAFIGIALLSFSCYLDYTVVNIALPTIQQELQTDLTSLQWVMNIYFLALCVLAAIMGRLGDLFGRRRCFYLGAGIFAIASLVAGFSSHILGLILGRALQGVGAAMVLPLGPSLLPQSFPENEQGKSIAWLGSVGGIALALGPVLGGIIVTHWGWRWIFFINIPIIILGYVFSLNVLKESVKDQHNVNLDWKGMVLLTFTMGGIVLSLIRSQTDGWEDIITWLYLAIGIFASVGLFKVESKQSHPLIDFSDFTHLLFFAGALLCFLAGVFSAVALFFDPLYLQIIRNQTPQFSGFILFAIPIAVFIIAFIVAWLITILGLIETILLGLFLAFISALLQLFFNSVIPLWIVVVAFISLGSMWAMGNTVPIIAAQTAVGPSRLSVATGTMVTMFNVGGSIGLAIAVVLYNFVSLRSLEYIHANHNEIENLAKLIANPSQSLQIPMTQAAHDHFHAIFMHGFSSVMWFLLVLSFISLLSIFIWKMKRDT